VTVYHSFHDEVDSYRTHVWQCDGPCAGQPPFFGLVKRSMNRAPGKADTWWAQHERDCGGSYSKIAEPALTKRQMEALSAKERAGLQKNKLDAWIRRPEAADTREHSTPEASGADAESKRGGTGKEVEALQRMRKRAAYPCPVCDKPVAEDEVNAHLDESHTTS
jgi:hypothetical protein